MRALNWIAWTAAALVLGTAMMACNSFKKANRENFTLALNSYFSAHDDCLYPSALRFPYETSTASKNPDFDALTGAGLLERNEEKAIKVKRYTLTTYAAHRVSGRFCYGHRQITSIDSFTPPALENGKQSTLVEYHFKMVDLPGWADSAQVQSAFPALAKATGDDAKDTTRLVLTMNGWRVPE